MLVLLIEYIMDEYEKLVRYKAQLEAETKAATIQLIEAARDAFVTEKQNLEKEWADKVAQMEQKAQKSLDVQKYENLKLKQQNSDLQFAIDSKAQLEAETKAATIQLIEAARDAFVTEKQNLEKEWADKVAQMEQKAQKSLDVQKYENLKLKQQNSDQQFTIDSMVRQFAQCQKMYLEQKNTIESLTLEVTQLKTQQNPPTLTSLPLTQNKTEQSSEILSENQIKCSQKTAQCKPKSLTDEGYGHNIMMPQSIQTHKTKSKTQSKKNNKSPKPMKTGKRKPPKMHKTKSDQLQKGKTHNIKKKGREVKSKTRQNFNEKLPDCKFQDHSLTSKVNSFPNIPCLLRKPKVKIKFH